MALYMKTGITYIFGSYLAHFFLEWEIFQKKLQMTTKHTFYIQYFFFNSKIVPFMR